MNAFKRFVITSIMLSFVLLGCVIGLLYVYDPLQLYHKPYFREITFSNDMRVQDKGIIKNYDFDSFILGTSMLENTAAKEADEKIWGKWVNISMAGSAFDERAVILHYLFRQKPNVKHILYSLDIGGLIYDPVADTKKFDFLYDENEINDLKIYLNQKYIVCALLYSKSTKCVGYDDLETLVNWAKKERHNQNFGGIQNWLPRQDIFPTLKNAIDKLKQMPDIHSFETAPFTESIEANQHYIEKNLLSLAKTYPNTQFHLVVPTYLRLQYRIEEPAYYAKAKKVLQWLVQEVQVLPNVKIYGFDDLDYADNIASYTDPTHYNVDMNSMQIDAIANGTHILTPENIDEYLQTMENKIKAYDLAPLIAEIKEWEANLSKTK